MSRDRILRLALWASVVLNLVGTAVFLAPALGQRWAVVPLDPPPYYAAELALIIGLFAAAYAWLALQAEIDRPLLALGGAGKIGFFAVSATFWWADDLTLEQALQATPDLLLGSVFVWYLLSSR